MKKNGFSLIELVVTMGIVAILAAIAIPAYTAYTQKANRTDATRTLTADAQALERCYSQTFTYVSCTGAPAGASTSAQGFYGITITVTAATGSVAAGYVITAVPAMPPQLSDSSCAIFSVDNTGAQSAFDNTHTINTQTCWGST